MKREGRVIGRPWKKGQSGNPRGRPPNPLCLTSRLKEMLGEVCPHDKQKRTWLEVIVEKTLKLAREGNPVVIKEILERVDGKQEAGSRVA